MTLHSKAAYIRCRRVENALKLAASIQNIIYFAVSFDIPTQSAKAYNQRWHLRAQLDDVIGRRLARPPFCGCIYEGEVLFFHATTKQGRGGNVKT